MSISKAIKKQHNLKRYIVNTNDTPVFKAEKRKDSTYRLTESPVKLQKGTEVFSDVYYDLPVFIKGSTFLVKINNGDTSFNLVNMGNLSFQENVIAEIQTNTNTDNNMRNFVDDETTNEETNLNVPLVNNDALDGINKGGTKKGMLILGIVAVVFIGAIFYYGSQYKPVKA